MANERLYLVHHDSGYGIMLGKHMGGEFYSPPNTEYFEKFYLFTYDWSMRHNDGDYENFKLYLEADLPYDFKSFKDWLDDVPKNKKWYQFWK